MSSQIDKEGAEIKAQEQSFRIEDPSVPWSTVKSPTKSNKMQGSQKATKS